MRRVCLLAGLLAVAAFPAVSQDEKEKAKDSNLASLEGRVTDAVTGTALKKVNVILNRRGGGTPSTFESDEKGEFHFLNLQPGKYGLAAQRAGYALGIYGSRGNSMAGATIELSIGQAMKNVEFKLTPNSVIAGRVLDDDGEPLPNVMVLAMVTTYQRGQKQYMPLGQAQTNDVGEFRVAGLKAGRYLLCATNLIGQVTANAMGQASKPTEKPEPSLVLTYYPHATEVSAASMVDVGRGAEVRGIDIRMIKVDGYRVKGKLPVAPEGGKPTMVMLSRKGGGMMDFVTAFRGMVQSDGSFELKGVPPGSYTLTSTRDFLSPSGTPQPVEVRDQHIKDLILQTGGTLELAGSVVVEGKDSDKVKLKDIQVTLDPVEGFSISPPKVSVGEDGKFALKDVVPGKYRVHHSGGTDAMFLKAVRYGTQDVIAEGIDVSSVLLTPFQLVLSVESASVDGSIVDADGQPMSGVTIVLVPDSRKHHLFLDQTTTTQGRFRFNAVPPGDYKLLAWEELDPGAYEDPEFLKKFEGRAETVQVKPGDRKTLQVKAIPAADTRM